MARQMFDIALDNTGDILINGGDFAATETTAEHQRSLLLDAPGDYKFAPLVCVGAQRFVDDDNPSNLVREISQQFMQDGMEVRDLVPNSISIIENVEKPFVNAWYK